MPMSPRSTRPFRMSSSAIWRTVLLETAKPRPSAPGSRRTTVLMPTTCFAAAQMSGPPEFPGLMGASVWSRSSRKIWPDSSGKRRPFPERTPEVTLFLNSPSGLPIATTVAPTGIWSLSPRGATFSVRPAGSIFRTATSVSGSRPTSCALARVSSAKITSNDEPGPPCSFETTWLFVAMCPVASRMKPEPLPTSRVPLLCTTVTTEGPSSRTTSTTGPSPGPEGALVATGGAVGRPVNGCVPSGPAMREPNPAPTAPPTTPPISAPIRSTAAPDRRFAGTGPAAAGTRAAAARSLTSEDETGSLLPVEDERRQECRRHYRLAPGAGGVGRDAGGRRRLAAPRGCARGLGLDHLADRGRAHFEIHVLARVEGDLPAEGELGLLVEALEARLRVRDRVHGLRRHLGRRVHGEGDVEVPRLGVDEHLPD